MRLLSVLLGIKMKLTSLGIKNFKRIGPDGCDIRIDQIVVLVGRNNVGKSTVLDAYEAFASSGTELSITHFHNEKTIHPVEITGVFCNITEEDEATISKKWTHEIRNMGVASRYAGYGHNPIKEVRNDH